MIDVVRRGWDAARWYVREVMGDNAYQRYLDHHSSHDPTAAPLSERDYWRTRYRDQEARPQGRCC
jgi:uncharacterized short protein YbdD (DUF466 family)